MLLGEKGSLERVRTRLQTISCPECNVSFDANRIVQLRIDKSAHSVTFAECVLSLSNAGGPRADASEQERSFQGPQEHRISSCHSRRRQRQARRTQEGERGPPRRRFSLQVSHSGEGRAPEGTPLLCATEDRR